jgi:hypothetical protein
MESKWSIIIALLGILMLIAAPASAQPTPFLIAGLANYTDNDPVDGPSVNVTNLNTGEEWTAETQETFNFYQVIITSDDVSDGDTLRITAKKMLPGGYTTPENYTYCVNITTVDVAQNEIDMGGLPELDLILDHFCINYYPDYPYFAQEAWNYSGAAVIKMWTEFKDEGPYDQDNLQAMGIANNTAGSDPYCIDPQGMAAVLNGLLPNHFTVGVHENTTEGLNHAMHRICWWQYLGPGSLPARGNPGGNYEFWMGIRGIHTDKNPHDGTYSAPYGYNVSGFWVNDPNTFGAGCIGENSYKTAVEWTETYYLPTHDPRIPGWNDKYITVLEPPEDEADIRIVPAKPRLARAITPVIMEKTLIVDGIERIADVEVVDDDDALDVVGAAIDAVSGELIPYDLQFADVFAETVAGEPMLVSGGNSDYYIVPFEVPAKAVKPAPKKAVEIQKFDGDAVTLLKAVDGAVAIEPIPIDPIYIDEKRTLVVVLVDAEDGSFKEASWVDEPMEYLLVSKVEALKLAYKGMKPLKAKPMIELIHRDGSTYYPDWKITIGKMVFFVSQDGTVTSEGPTLVPVEPEPMLIAK